MRTAVAPSSPMRGFLLVRSGDRRFGLPVEHLVEVLEPGAVFAVPSLDPAVRGVTSLRGRLIPLVHLGALLDGTACPASSGGTGIIVTVGCGRVCLEVDEAEAVVRGLVVPAPSGAALPWAAGTAQQDGQWIPLLDLSALGARFKETPR